MEMVVYFTGKAAQWQIPDNVLAQLKRFSKFEVEAIEEQQLLVVKVPKKEVELSEKLREDIRILLLELQKENSVLAQKLARYYHF